MAFSVNQRRKQLRKAQKRRGKKNVQCQVGQSPTAGVRMSDVIRHLAEPIVAEFSKSIDDLERIITLTIAAWNLTLFSSDVQSQQFQRVSRKYFGQGRESVAMFRWICDVVAERKLRFYPHLNNAIIDVHFTRESANTLYFEVAYSLAPNTVR